MNRLIPFAACWLLMALSTAEAADEAEFVPRWQPRDFAFRTDQKLDRPFSVAFAAEATGPGGVRLRIPGFYDGDGTWKVRLSPTIEGDWSLVTRSSLPALDNRQAAFRCQRKPSPLVHGSLIVDPQYPRHFVYEDGTRFYLLGDEHGPQGLADKTYNVVQSPEEVCRRGWEVCMAGGYGCYYYTYTAWDVLRPQDNPPGYAYFKHLRDFFETTAYWRLDPVDGVVSDGYCLAEPGREYVVFLNKARPFSLKLEGLAGSLQAQWYHPFTGKRQDAGVLPAGSAELTPPAEWGALPVVLHVGSAQR